MNYRMTAYLFGVLLTIESALLLIPTVVSAIYGESVLPFLYTVLIVVAVAIPLVLLKPKNTRIIRITIITTSTRDIRRKQTSRIAEVRCSRTAGFFCNKSCFCCSLWGRHIISNIRTCTLTIIPITRTSIIHILVINCGQYVSCG